MRFVLRMLCIVAVLLLIPVVGAVLFERGGAVGGAMLSMVAVLWLWLWLPRLAHGAFNAGKFRAAATRYRWGERLAVTPVRERAARLSRAGCAIAMNEVAAAERLLASFDVQTLHGAERAVWLNNRACARLPADPTAALADADEATALRPDVPALQHTRAMALLALDRIDDAITILDAMRAGGELPRRLEADRCRELARAWERKGQSAYAEDYRLRAEAFAR